MSLFAGGSECSTSKNPLSQFSKHSLNSDNALHKNNNSAFIGGPQGLDTRNIVHERSMNQADTQKFNQFLNGNNGASASSGIHTGGAPLERNHSFNMQPLNRELNSIQLQPQRSGSPSTSIGSALPLHTTGLKNHAPNWSLEFDLHHQPQQQQPRSGVNDLAVAAGGSNVSYQPRFMNNLMFANSGMMQQRNLMQPGVQQQYQQNQQHQDIHQDINWDDHFKDIEKEMHSNSQEKAKISEVLDDANGEVVQEIRSNSDLKHNIDQTNINDGGLGIEEDEFNATFEEIWNNVKQKDIDDDLYNHDAYLSDDYLNADTDPSIVAVSKYKFTNMEENQFASMPNPYEIGLQLMQSGAKLSEAALAFEAAVQQDATHFDAWIKLGEVQSANEKEVLGLRAYYEALQIDPNNLTALMNLSIGYINEGFDNAAIKNLRQWLALKYPHSEEIFQKYETKAKGDVSSSSASSSAPVILPYIDKNDILINTFLEVVRTDANAANVGGAALDPDLQLGLGVLFYANGQFDKTVDCFRTALQVQPENEILWNRLGAALANSNRAEDAIDAYFQALRLKPSFVRARYNLGVSCIAIGCYKQAAQHLLAGLSLHKVDGAVADSGNDYKDGQIFNISPNQSNSLLESLKRAFICMERHDLADRVKPDMDLNQFRNEFEF